MRSSDFIKLTLGSIIAHRMRSVLTAIGIAVGIAAVVLLTSIGEGLHKYVMSEFSQFGSNIINIQPGTTQTHGGNVAALSNIRPLKIDDARAIEKLSQVIATNSVVQGNAEVEFYKKQRRTVVYGVNASFPQIFEIYPAIGKFLPDDDDISPRPYVVLGHKVKQELFANKNPLGEKVRLGGFRYRVIGVMESKGQILGVDVDDAVYIPTTRAMELFNRQSLMEIQVKYQAAANVDDLINHIQTLLINRHGQEDFTILTQEQMLEVMSSILNVLTLAVGALGGISLFVGGIGVLTIMTIAVNERISEIGLFRALGATKNQIMVVFLGEAIVLASLGGFFGLLIGIGGAHLLTLTIPNLPVHTPWSFVIGAESLAVAIGLLAGVLPARRAANLDPIDALRTE